MRKAPFANSWTFSQITAIPPYRLLPRTPPIESLAATVAEIKIIEPNDLLLRPEEIVDSHPGHGISIYLAGPKVFIKRSVAAFPWSSWHWRASLTKRYDRQASRITCGANS